MSVQTLQAAIAERASAMLGEALVSGAMVHHCRRKGNWRTCSCSWCDKKREATRVIGSHVPKIWRGQYVEDIRHVWREEQRQKYRQALTVLATE